MVQYAGLTFTSGPASDLKTVYNTALNPSIAVATAVGGIPVGTTAGFLYGKNLVELFDDILFPTILPTYSIPTILLSSSVTGSYEIGATLSPTLTVTGTKNDAGVFTFLSLSRTPSGGSQVRISSTSSPTQTSETNVPNQFGYADPNNPNFRYTLSFGDSLTGPAPAPGNNNGTLTYAATGSYSSGVAKQNNKGVYDTRTSQTRNINAPQSAATNFGSTQIILNGYYPYFYGKTPGPAGQKTAPEIVSIIESGSGFTKVTALGSGQLSMAFNAIGEWPWFAVFSGYVDKTTWYVDETNKGSIGGSTNLFASPTVLSVTSPSGIWVATYKIYPSNKLTSIGTALIS